MKDIIIPKEILKVKDSLNINKSIIFAILIKLRPKPYSR